MNDAVHFADTANTIVWRNDQADPFAAALPHEDPDANGTNFEFNLRFPGQHFDKETGLHYNYFRDYDPAIGRYVQSDPIGLAGGDVSLYVYGKNDPLRYVDPLGLSAFGDFFLGAGSYVRGIYRTGRYAARRAGIFGKCDKQRAEFEGLVMTELMNQLIHNSQFRQRAMDAGAHYVSKNKAFVAGRTALGSGVSATLARYGGSYGMALGAVLPLAALNGDIRAAIEGGVDTAEGIAEAVAAGVAPSSDALCECR